MENQAMAEMPRYRCHKEVWALKIKSIEAHRPTIDQLQKILDSPHTATWQGPDAATITPEDSGYAPFGVSLDFMQKHKPEPGGYFVVYKDGYKSFSPAEAFEDGYTRI